MNKSILSQSDWHCIAFWNKQKRKNPDCIRASFNLKHYIKYKTYLNGIKKT